MDDASFPDDPGYYVRGARENPAAHEAPVSLSAGYSSTKEFKYQGNFLVEKMPDMIK